MYGMFNTTMPRDGPTVLDRVGAGLAGLDELRQRFKEAAGNRQPNQTHIGEQIGPTTVQRFIPSGRTVRP